MMMMMMIMMRGSVVRLTQRARRPALSPLPPLDTQAEGDLHLEMFCFLKMINSQFVWLHLWKKEKKTVSSMLDVRDSSFWYRLHIHVVSEGSDLLLSFCWSPECSFSHKAARLCHNTQPHFSVCKLVLKWWSLGEGRKTNNFDRTSVPGGDDGDVSSLHQTLHPSRHCTG